MKTGLQIVVGILSLIPAIFGLMNTWIGAARFLPPEAVNPLIDSQFRFQSAIYFGIAILIWWVIPRIDKQIAVFRIVAFAIFLGGLARLLSYMTVGFPNNIMFGAMFLELGVPLLILWQNAIRTDKQ